MKKQKRRADNDARSSDNVNLALVLQHHVYAQWAAPGEKEAVLELVSAVLEGVAGVVYSGPTRAPLGEQ